MCIRGEVSPLFSFITIAEACSNLRLARITIVLLLLLPAVACSRPSSSSGAAKEERRSKHAGARDLSVDESRGGHVLSRHVGLSDADLRERLRREPNISAASTYNDRRAAEDLIGNCISENSGRIQVWLDRDRHPNLVLDCIGDPAWPLGRTLHRGRSQAEPCSKANAVLKFDPPRGYYVLTSYPDCE